MEKTKVKYELTIQPNLPPSHEHYQRELTNRRLEKMQFPTRDEQFKRRLEAGGARIVTQSSGDKSASKERDRGGRKEDRVLMSFCMVTSIYYISIYFRIYYFSRMS